MIGLQGYVAAVLSINLDPHKEHVQMHMAQSIYLFHHACNVVMLF